jgi:hypothetical protein
MSKSAGVHPWLVRLSWLAVPFTAGTAIADALSGRSHAVQITAAVVLWAAWVAVVVGMLVPRPAGLVGLRVGALALVPIVAWAADSALDWAVAGVHVLVMLALAMTPLTAEWLVNGTAYGYERRYLLRAPAPLLIGPILVAALLLPAAVLTGPLLLASRQWVLGALAVAAGAPVAVILFRALHSMAMRWAVLVPAGFVLKDHLALLDPVLFRRTDIETLQPAPADTDAMDLTAGAPGLALELRLREEQHIDRMRPVRRGSEPFEVWKLLFTPTRPDALLRDAGSRRIRVVERSAQ